MSPDHNKIISQFIIIMSCFTLHYILILEKGCYQSVNYLLGGHGWQLSMHLCVGTG